MIAAQLSDSARAKPGIASALGCCATCRGASFNIGSRSKLEIYRRLGVREVWFWERDVLSLHVLRGRKWLKVKRSDCLPELDTDVLCGFLDRPTMTTAMRDFRDFLQASRRPRRRS